MNVAHYEMRDGALPPEEQGMLESESGNRYAEWVPEVMETMAMEPWQACWAALSRRVAEKFEH
ncbi:MAG: hypothetical protein ABI167_06175 [Nitrosospira sp.]